MENIKKVKIDIDRYRVKENEKVNLKKFPTKRDVDIDKEEVKSTFFPEVIEQLKVYQEKLYAVGRIPGGYIKREGRGSMEATLNARQMDRPIRPLFPEGFKNDVQVIATVLSVAPEE